MLGFIDLKWPRVTERSNVGLFFSQWLVMVCYHYSVTDPNLKPIFCVHSSIKAADDDAGNLQPVF